MVQAPRSARRSKCELKYTRINHNSTLKRPIDGKMKRAAKPPVQRTTLFQSWNKPQPSTSSNSWHNPKPSTAKSEQNNNNCMIDLCDGDDDDDDDELLLAAEMHESILHAEDPTKCPPMAPSLDEHGFDRSAGHIWIYPTNYPVREYQFNIVKTALFGNTLVTLPTGLGKTFIAAVVMYNFYRWYPGGKVIFMAPTKPLVAQQIEACYKIMGIPQTDTAEMTGEMQPPERERHWRQKRVFFLTPQCLVNDIQKNITPAMSVKCLVIDEAHKASGNHAYCQVVRELTRHQDNFRILALSATPGGDIKAVQAVVSNLLISCIELRTEDSPDIKQYSFERSVEKIVVQLTGQMLQIKDKYFRILRTVTERLIRYNVLYNRPPDKMTQFLLLRARDQFRQNPPADVPPNKSGVIEGDFALAISLYHGYDLLQLHGLRSFWKYLEGVASGEKVTGRTRSMMVQSDLFSELLDEMRQTFKDDTLNQSIGSQKPAPVSAHPKLDQLTKVVLDHFNTFNTEHGNSNTRVMIFSQYRDSVQEITQLLSKHQPVVKCMSFIGQSVGKSSKGFSQKEQLRVMREFREGGFNTLVSTCVGEEGLDIGDVDLIICFDAPKSPIRLVQRMGRTGRKRKGRIVVLLTAGKEENTYNQSQCSKRSINKAILNSNKTLQFYPNNAKLFPENIAPKAHKMFIEVKEKFFGAAKKRGRAQSTIATTSSTGAFLSAAERREFEEKYQIYERMPVKSNTEILCLRKPDALSQEPDVNQPLVDFAEWLPWQTTLQASVNVGSSDRSRDLVEMLNLIEVQAMADPDDHTNFYRLLNIDETHKPEPDGIMKFVTNGNPDTDTEKRDEKARTKEPKVKRKKKVALPALEADDDFDAGEMVGVSESEVNLLPDENDDVIIDDDDDDFPMVKIPVPKLPPQFEKNCYFGRVPPAPSVDFLDFMEDEKMDFSQVDVDSIKDEWERKMKPRLRKSDAFDSRKPEVPEVFRKPSKSPEIPKPRKSSSSPGLAEVFRNKSPSVSALPRKSLKTSSPMRIEPKTSPLFSMRGSPVPKPPSTVKSEPEVDLSTNFDFVDSLHDSVFANIMDDFPVEDNENKTTPPKFLRKHSDELPEMLTSESKSEMEENDVTSFESVQNAAPSSNSKESDSPPNFSIGNEKRKFTFTPTKKQSAKSWKTPIDHKKVDYHNAFDLSMSLFDDSPDSLDSLGSTKTDEPNLPFKNYETEEENAGNMVKNSVPAETENANQEKLIGTNEMDYFLENDSMAETPFRTSRPKSSVAMSTPYCPKTALNDDFLSAISPVVHVEISAENNSSKRLRDDNVKKIVDFEVNFDDSSSEGQNSAEMELVESYRKVKKAPTQFSFTQALSWVGDNEEKSDEKLPDPKNVPRILDNSPEFKVPLAPKTSEKSKENKTERSEFGDRSDSRSDGNTSSKSSDDSTKSDIQLESKNEDPDSLRMSLLDEFSHSFHSILADEKIEEKSKNYSKVWDGMSFDLGFDFDEELSDSDFIPPTPRKPEANSTRFTTANPVSILEATTSKNDEESNEVKGDDKIVAENDLESKRNLSPVRVPEFDEFPKMDSEGFDILAKPLDSETRDLDENFGNKESTSPPSSPSLLRRKKRTKLRNKETAATFVDNHSDDEFKCPKIPGNSKSKEAVGAMKLVSKVSDLRQEFGDVLMAESLKSPPPIPNNSHSSDEEIVMKKRKLVAIVSSPDMTPLGKRQKKVARCLDSSPEFKTPEKPRPKKAETSLQPKFLPMTSNIPDDDDDDDFARVDARTTSETTSDSEVEVKPKSKVARRKMAVGFLEHEAEVSDEEDFASSDEDEENLDEYDNSFINDMSQQASQPQTQPFDERAMYLQSVAAARDNKKLYQMSHAARNRMDIFSQMPEPDVEDYLEDSFCVEEADESDLDLGDLEVTLAHHDVTMGGPKTRRMRRAQNAEAQKREPKRRRAYQISDSDEN